MPFDPSTPQRGRRAYLPRRESLILNNAEGTTITVDAGCLWVTMERDPRDIVLLPGMSFEIDRTGRTVIAAEDDSRLARAARGTGNGALDVPPGAARRPVLLTVRAEPDALAAPGQRLTKLSLPPFAAT